MKPGRILIGVVCLAAPALAFGQEATDEAPVAQVRCNDGTLSEVGYGDCEGHGGTAKATAEPTKKTPVTVEEDKRIAPQTPSMGTAATVRCKDGTMSAAGEGACSNNGGIDKNTGAAPQAVPESTARPPADTGARAANPKAELTPNPPVQTLAPGRATALCKDGTKSPAMQHSGTCSGHAGIDRWLDASAP